MLLMLRSGCGVGVIVVGVVCELVVVFTAVVLLVVFV